MSETRPDKRIGTSLKLLAGPATAALLWAWAVGADLGYPIAITLAVTAWCAVWWFLEATGHAITALLPLALFPVLGVLEPEQVAGAYGNPLILLLAGGFMMAAALERNGAHRRMALGMVRLVGGGSGRRLVWGFALAAGLTSMWISNTATTLMLLPVAMAVLEKYPDRRLLAPLVLAIAYSASIGGLGTPIGSPPNLVFMQVYEQTTGAGLGFGDWMRFGIPAVLLFLPLAALWLGRGLAHTPAATLPE
ncbi:MAG: sodium:dicarboxylate symporter, partial [Gammaproteobacteria bacterium HGW-Gammaproteobacteria-7]